MTTSALVRLLLLSVALTAAAPVLAQKQSLADRVTQLEQQSSAQSSSAGQANVELLNRITQMQTEIQTLRNQLEQLQNENEQAKQRARQQYVDLDARLQRLEGGDATVPAAPVAGAPSPMAAPATAGTSNAQPANAAAPALSAADEQAAYASAFDALRAGDYVASARGFQAYLRSFPQGSLAPNAWYWLGESYYVTQNFPVALQSFESLLNLFPNSAKAPDALLKQGYCQIEMGDVGRGQQTLNRVINEYPNSDASRLALGRLRALSLESR